MMLTGFEVVLLIPAPVGVAAAVNETVPRFDGRQLHVAEKLELDPLANLFLQPGSTLPLTLNVTLDATVIFAVITTTVRKVAVVAEPAKASELNDEVSTTSVTVIVIDCVPALLAASVAVSVSSKTLLPPTSTGASKSGETLNLIIAVSVSDLAMLNLAASAPDEIVTVADSEMRIVAAVAEVAMFSAAEKDEDEVKVGGVVSGA